MSGLISFFMRDFLYSTVGSYVPSHTFTYYTRTSEFAFCLTMCCKANTNQISKYLCEHVSCHFTSKVLLDMSFESGGPFRKEF